VPLQDRPGMLHVVAVTVIEGEDREGPRSGPGCDAIPDRVDGDQVIPLAPKLMEYAIEEFGCYFEHPVGRKGSGAPRPHAVKHQDHAATPSEMTKPAICAQCRDCAESASEQPMLELHEFQSSRPACISVARRLRVGVGG
jgi:hypothetical protein